MKLLISGGIGSGIDFKKEEAFQYHTAVLLLLNTKNEKVEYLLKYKIPKNSDHYFSNNAACTFKSFSKISNDKIILCTNTELIIFNVTDRKIIEIISHPLMNDVHHAILHHDKYYVANTGRDSVLVLSKKGELVEEFDLSNYLNVEPLKSIKYRFKEVKDFRKIPSTKPHLVHPNYISVINGEINVTRFFQKDLFSIISGRKIKIEAGNPHDGIITNDGLFCTMTNGKIFRKYQSKDYIYDLVKWGEYKSFYKNRSIGWQRGILPINKNRLWVGYSALRPSRSIEYLIDIKHKFTGENFVKSAPTRVDLYDYSVKKLINSIRLDNYISAIFSIDTFE